MITKERLEELYSTYTKKSYLNSDPVMFLFNYDTKEDIEFVGLISSSFAYGRVAQILRAISSVLEPMGKRPVRFLLRTGEERIRSIFSGFRYRFTSGEEIGSLFVTLKRLYHRYGSLGAFFSAPEKVDSNERFSGTIYPYLVSFTNRLLAFWGVESSSLIPNPSKGSACKRLNLFLRWMIRDDEIDFGLWSDFNPSLLIFPLDTHIHKIGLNFGFTRRITSSIMTAWEITEGFRKINPEDPLKYDFALTRPGILNEKDVRRYLEGD